jgi:hypothetical protein
LLTTNNLSLKYVAFPWFLRLCSLSALTDWQDRKGWEDSKSWSMVVMAWDRWTEGWLMDGLIYTTLI